MNIFSRTGYSIVAELALVDVPILMIEDSLPLGLILVPEAFVLGPVRPYLEAETVFI